MYYVHVLKKVYMYGMQPSLNTKSCILRPFCSTLIFIHLNKKVFTLCYIKIYASSQQVIRILKQMYLNKIRSSP